MKSCPYYNFPYLQCGELKWWNYCGGSILHRHIRRMPHHTWKDALSLVMDLLLGFGKRRYFNMARVWQRASRVDIKGFSAGSYVGLALVHVLREIKSVRTRSVLGAIACPPSFLKVPDDRHTVHLIHYVPDKLCRWNHGQPFLDTLRCKYTIVNGHFDLHQHHFWKGRA